MYDPNVGRWISEDPLGYARRPGERLTEVNLYLYCRNNPVNRIDPSGKEHLTIGDAEKAKLASLLDANGIRYRAEDITRLAKSDLMADGSVHLFVVHPMDLKKLEQLLNNETIPKRYEGLLYWNYHTLTGIGVRDRARVFFNPESKLDAGMAAAMVLPGAGAAAGTAAGVLGGTGPVRGPQGRFLDISIGDLQNTILRYNFELGYGDDELTKAARLQMFDPATSAFATKKSSKGAEKSISELVSNLEIPSAYERYVEGLRRYPPAPPGKPPSQAFAERFLLDPLKNLLKGELENALKLLGIDPGEVLPVVDAIIAIVLGNDFDPLLQLLVVKLLDALALDKDVKELVRELLEAALTGRPVKYDQAIVSALRIADPALGAIVENALLGKKLGQEQAVAVINLLKVQCKLTEAQLDRILKLLTSGGKPGEDAIKIIEECCKIKLFTKILELRKAINAQDAVESAKATAQLLIELGKLLPEGDVKKRLAQLESALPEILVYLDIAQNLRVAALELREAIRKWKNKEGPDLERVQKALRALANALKAGNTALKNATGKESKFLLGFAEALLVIASLLGAVGVVANDFLNSFFGIAQVVPPNLCKPKSGRFVYTDENVTLPNGTIDKRATQAEAYITPDTVGGLYKAFTKNPAWWGQLIIPEDLKPEKFRRGHLIGSQLGGSGGEEFKNLVPLYPKANHPAMEACEDYVRKLVEDCGYCVSLRVKPLYRKANDLVPYAIRFEIISEQFIGNRLVQVAPAQVFMIDNTVDGKKPDECDLKKLPCRPRR